MQQFKNLSTHQRTMIEAFLAGKTIQVSSNNHSFIDAEDFDTEEGYPDCRTLTVINRFTDSALRIKPEPVITYYYQGVSEKGWINEDRFLHKGSVVLHHPKEQGELAFFIEKKFSDNKLVDMKIISV